MQSDDKIQIIPLSERLEKQIVENTTESLSTALDDNFSIRMVVTNKDLHYDAKSRFLMYVDTTMAHCVILADKKAIHIII